MPESLAPKQRGLSLSGQKPSPGGDSMHIRILALMFALLPMTGCRSRVDQPLWSFQADQKISAASFSPDGTLLALAGEGGKVWLLDSAGQSRNIAPGPEMPAFLIFSADGKWLAAASDKRRDVCWWKVEDGKLLTSVDAGKAAKAAQEISHEAILWMDAQSGMVSRKSTAYVGGEAGTTVAGLAFSEDDLLSTDTRGSVEFWSPDGALTKVFGVEAIVSLAQVSPAGNRLALSGGNRLRVVDLADGKMILELAGNSDFRPLVFSPSGDYLATTSLGESKLISLSGKSVAMRFPAGVRAYDFSGDGRYLACASSDKIEIWNVNTKALEGEMALRADDVHVLESGQGVLVRQESQVLGWRIGQPEATWKLERSARRWAVSSSGQVALVLDQGQVECWQPPSEP